MTTARAAVTTMIIPMTMAITTIIMTTNTVMIAGTSTEAKAEVGSQRSEFLAAFRLRVGFGRAK